jgi:hypothetical protein
MAAFGGARGVGAKPPEKGIFPLDHFGECKQVGAGASKQRHLPGCSLLTAAALPAGRGCLPLLPQSTRKECSRVQEPSQAVSGVQNGEVRCRWTFAGSCGSGLRQSRVHQGQTGQLLMLCCTGLTSALQEPDG